MWRIFNKVFGWHYIAFRYKHRLISRRVKFMYDIEFLKQVPFIKIEGKVFYLQEGMVLTGVYDPYLMEPYRFLTCDNYKTLLLHQLKNWHAT